MSKKFFMLIIVITFGILAFTSTTFAQGQSNWAFQRVRAVKQQYAGNFMALQGVQGIAIGLDENNQYALKVFTVGPVVGIPRNINGVPVRVEVTGRFYALKPPGGSPPGQDKKPPKNTDTTPPETPSNLQVVNITDNSISLTWDPIANTANDLAGYNIYCSMISEGSYSLIGSTIATSYTDSGLLSGTTYYYVVTAEDTSGNESPFSNEVEATTSGDAPAPIVDRDGWCSRPVPIGVSTGHPNITAGTIGCRLIDNLGNYYALSNNHVYANMNKAKIGDNVLQPGTYDGGVNPDDAIGVLFTYVPIVFYPRGINYVDAAIAWIGSQELGFTVQVGTPSDGYGTPSSNTVSATIGLDVQKYGRTTGLQKGTVSAIDFDGYIIYGGRLAYFVDQIVVTPGTFSAGGDSGSLIVTDDENNNPVGLLFAGSDTYTIANPIDWVLEDLAASIEDVDTLWIDGK